MVLEGKKVGVAVVVSGGSATPYREGSRRRAEAPLLALPLPPYWVGAGGF